MQLLSAVQTERGVQLNYYGTQFLGSLDSSNHDHRGSAYAQNMMKLKCQPSDAGDSDYHYAGRVGGGGDGSQI